MEYKNLSFSSKSVCDAMRVSRVRVSMLLRQRILNPDPNDITDFITPSGNRRLANNARILAKDMPPELISRCIELLDNPGMTTWEGDALLVISSDLNEILPNVWMTAMERGGFVSRVEMPGGRVMVPIDNFPRKTRIKLRKAVKVREQKRLASALASRAKRKLGTRGQRWQFLVPKYR